jgi:hypothetical protein
VSRTVGESQSVARLVSLINAVQGGTSSCCAAPAAAAAGDACARRSKSCPANNNNNNDNNDNNNNGQTRVTEASQFFPSRLTDAVGQSQSGASMLSIRANTSVAVWKP